jgi:hypothetical protein
LFLSGVFLFFLLLFFNLFFFRCGQDQPSGENVLDLSQLSSSVYKSSETESVALSSLNADEEGTEVQHEKEVDDKNRNHFLKPFVLIGVAATIVGSSVYLVWRQVQDPISKKKTNIQKLFSRLEKSIVSRKEKDWKTWDNPEGHLQIARLLKEKITTEIESLSLENRADLVFLEKIESILLRCDSEHPGYIILDIEYELKLRKRPPNFF